MRRPTRPPLTHAIRPQGSAVETASLPFHNRCAPGLIISLCRVPTEPIQFESRFGDLDDTIQPPVFLPVLGANPVSCSIHRWATHVCLISLMSFFVAFVFMTLVDSEGRWQRYPTAAVITVVITLLTLCLEDLGGDSNISGTFPPLSGTSRTAGRWSSFAHRI